MYYKKIEDFLFEKYCIEGEDKDLCKLMEEHDREIRDKVIDEFAKSTSTKISDLVLQHKDNLDFASGIAVVWNIIDEIAEQMSNMNRKCDCMDHRYLFKAKRIDTKEWIVGNYLTNGVGNHFINVFQKDGKFTYDMYEIDRTTLCQCTGFKDKNENVIWENDVVKIGRYKYLIWWNREGNEMTAIPITNIYFNGMDYMSHGKQFPYHDFVIMMQDPYGDFIDEIEDIGSIIDNPELLEIELCENY